MSIRIQCANCTKRYLLADRAAGRSIKCRNCAHQIVIPAQPQRQRDHRGKQAGLACPVCDDSILHEKTIRGGHNIDVCRSCGGCWLDGGEFLQLTAEHESAQQGLLMLSWDAVKTERRCPACRVFLREGAFLDDKTKIDLCGDCGGLWFDAGELKDSLKFLKTLDLARESDLFRKSDSSNTNLSATGNGRPGASLDGKTPESSVRRATWLSYLVIHVIHRFLTGFVVFGLTGAILHWMVNGPDGDVSSMFVASFAICSILWSVAVSLGCSRKVVQIRDKRSRVVTDRDSGTDAVQRQVDTSLGTLQVSKRQYEFLQAGCSYRCWVFESVIRNSVVLAKPFEKVTG